MARRPVEELRIGQRTEGADDVPEGRVVAREVRDLAQGRERIDELSLPDEGEPGPDGILVLLDDGARLMEAGHAVDRRRLFGDILAALDLGDMGIQTYLVEREQSIGGTMAQLNKTFPTMDCSI